MVLLGKITLFILFILVIAGVFNQYQNKGARDGSDLEPVIIEKPDERSETYSSKNLKFMIQVPKGMSAEERFTNVLLASSSGEIRISRIGTDLDSIDNYINNLELKNKIAYENKEFGKMGGYDAVYVTFPDPNERSREFSEIVMFVEGWIYKFSTTNDALRPILKVVAQSFEYRP